MKKLLIVICFILIISTVSGAQQKYWIYLKDKTTNLNVKYSNLDSPISAKYLQILKKKNVAPIIISKWLNALSANLNQTQIEELNTLSFILKIELIDKHIFVTSANSLKDINFSRALDQINADTLIQLGLSGKGVKIGIIDAGFRAANTDLYLNSIIEQNRILGYRNFINPAIIDPYGGSFKNNDSHGTNVFRAIAGKRDLDYTGLANSALFYLALTDETQREYHGEEDFWVAALEWMHDQGVRLVNSSLGYSDGYDNPKENYLPSDVNGYSSAITRATEIAIIEKGMTIVISAGNDGNDDFKIISIPADTKGIISVGASGYRYWNKLDYSSIGPEHLDAVKPEISCFAANGTSFSAPVITGLIACMMEYKPDIENSEILEIIEKSGHLYPYPNNYLGYGVPDAVKIINLLSGLENQEVIHSEIEAAESYRIITPKSYNIMAYHKKNKTIVLEQEKLRWENGYVIIRRNKNANYTTVATANQVWEIKWID